MPGRELRASERRPELWAALEVDWLQGDGGGRRADDTATVAAVGESTATVEWTVLCAAPAGAGADAVEPPGEEQPASALTLVDNRAAAWWRLGWRGRLGGSTVQVVGVETLCAVAWQDGAPPAVSVDLPAARLGLAHPAPHDVFPGDFARLRHPPAAESGAPPPPYAWVEAMDPATQMVTLHWREPAPTPGAEGGVYGAAAVVSAYDLLSEPDLAFRSGSSRGGQLPLMFFIARHF
jgi:hypothetical protein